jgi:ketose-bisphosphate aldolase
MKFAPMKALLDLAEKKNIAYGAYVVVSYQSAAAIIEAGCELNIPVIYIAGTDCIELMGGFEATVETVKYACKSATVPVALHLDHSRSFEDCCRAINAGFSSVMMDGSALPFEENIAVTKKVVEYAHPLEITVEGELGRLVGEEGRLIVEGSEGAQTDPEQAKVFVEATGIDCLAVSIGTQHGVYVAAPKLNIERLKKIHEVINVPLVLHGGSGTPESQVQDAIKNGIRKVNVATDIMISIAESYEKQKRKPGFKYNTAMFDVAKNDAKTLVMERMKSFSFMSGK